MASLTASLFVISVINSFLAASVAIEPCLESGGGRSGGGRSGGGIYTWLLSSVNMWCSPSVFISLSTSVCILSSSVKGL